MIELKSCGCIPFKRELFGIMVLMVESFTGERHWGFPKGKQEPNETEIDTAIRELEEETGLRGTIVNIEPIVFDYEYSDGNEQYHKTIKYFFCEVPNDVEVEIEESEIFDFQWLGLDEIEGRATFSSMKEVARKVKEQLENLKNQP